MLGRIPTLMASCSRSLSASDPLRCVTYLDGRPKRLHVPPPMRLWLSAWINFSLLPLRVATLLGLAVSIVGLLGFAWIVALWLNDLGPPQGWGWLMSGILVFSGVQLGMLGIVGEYLGRMFLTVNQKPQSVIRSVEHSPLSS